MKVEIKSLDDRNNANLTSYFETEFMKKVFLYKFDFKDWNLFSKDYQIKKFFFSVRINEKIGDHYITVEIDMIESDYHIKRLIQYLEKYLENTLEDYTQWLYSCNSFSMIFEGEEVYL